jgi:hypothetical protein
MSEDLRLDRASTDLARKRPARRRHEQPLLDRRVNIGEISRPRALAVLRLMTNSNRVPRRIATHAPARGRRKPMRR